MATIFNAPDREYHGPARQFSQTIHRLYRNATVYIAVPATARLALGIGFFAPCGMGTAWPPSWEGRYLTTFSSLRTYNLNPVLSVKLHPRLSVAAGFNVLWSAVRLKRKFKLPIANLPDGEIDLGGEGHGWGYNLGALYEPLAGVKLGLAYRSNINVTHKGDLDVKLSAMLPGTLPVNGQADLNFPDSLTLGVAVSRFPPFTFEFDATRTGWSSYDQLKLELNNPILVNGVPNFNLVTPKHWTDVWAFRFGANYALSGWMKIRAGYIYDLNPVPDDTFDPQVPDANRHILGIGGRLKLRALLWGSPIITSS